MLTENELFSTHTRKKENHGQKFSGRINVSPITQVVNVGQIRISRGSSGWTQSTSGRPSWARLEKKALDRFYLVAGRQQKVRPGTGAAVALRIDLLRWNLPLRKGPGVALAQDPCRGETKNKTKRKISPSKAFVISFSQISSKCTRFFLIWHGATHGIPPIDFITLVTFTGLLLICATCANDETWTWLNQT